VARADGAGYGAGPPETLTEGLAASAPLFVIAGLLFAAAYLFWRDGGVVGPRSFPLWDLLIALGMLATAGGILSWFFATSGPTPARARRAPRPATDRAEYGRPRPEVSRPGPTPAPTGGIATALAAYGSPTRPIWSEDELPVPLPRPPVRARSASSGPTAPSTGSDGVNRMLAELDEIEQAVARRRRAGEPAPSP
jgi:hypothetical protein